jgi:hypothetical protein
MNEKKEFNKRFEPILGNSHIFARTNLFWFFDDVMRTQSIFQYIIFFGLVRISQVMNFLFCSSSTDFQIR